MAVDPETGEVGVAAATCTVGVELIAAVVPGRGAVAAQARTGFASRNAARARLAAGDCEPRSLLAAAEGAAGGLLGSPWDEQQLAVATLDGDGRARVGCHTGRGTLGWAGSDWAEGVGVQGNMLRGAAVVNDCLAAFVGAGPGVPLAERMLRGLEAGRDAGGDNRCPRACPAQTAFLQVARPDDPPGRPGIAAAAPRAFGLRGAIRHRLLAYRLSEDPVALLRRRVEALG